MQTPPRVSPLHAYHIARRAVMTSRAGWLVPLRYRDPDQEAAQIREGGGILDRSAAGKIEIAGVNLPAWLTRVLGEESRMAPGQAMRVTVGDIGPIVCCRLRDDRGMIFTAPEQTTHTLEGLNQTLEAGLHITDMTSVYAGIQIIGPHSRALLQKLTALDVRPSRLPVMGCVQGPVARVPGLILRDDAGGLPAYRLFVTRDYGEFVWDTVCRLGEGCGMTPVGLAAYEWITE